jgi:hypothetical protein
MPDVSGNTRKPRRFYFAVCAGLFARIIIAYFYLFGIIARELNCQILNGDSSTPKKE